MTVSQHERVVGVQPERDLLVARQLVHRGGRQLVDVAVELRALRLERAVVDIAVADVEIEQLIEGLRPARFAGFLRDRRGDDEAGDRRTSHHLHAYAGFAFHDSIIRDYTRWLEERRERGVECVRAAPGSLRCPARGMRTISEPAIARASPRTRPAASACPRRRRRSASARESSPATASNRDGS